MTNRMTGGGILYPISVDYEKSVEDAVRDGRYDWACPDITSSNFPTPTRRKRKKVEVVMELLDFNRVTSTDEVLCELDKAGYRPLELRELLAFGEKRPEFQREFPIVALGSTWMCPYSGNRRLVPYLGGLGSERRLNLFWVGCGWSQFCRFAAVRVRK